MQHSQSPIKAEGGAVMQCVYAQSEAKSLFCFEPPAFDAPRRDLERSAPLLYSETQQELS
jgi:hypothetical protein